MCVADEECVTGIDILSRNRSTFYCLVVDQLAEDTGSAIRKTKFTCNVFLQQNGHARNEW